MRQTDNMSLPHEAGELIEPQRAETLIKLIQAILEQEDCSVSRRLRRLFSQLLIEVSGAYQHHRIEWQRLKNEMVGSDETAASLQASREENETAIQELTEQTEDLRSKLDQALTQRDTLSEQLKQVLALGCQRLSLKHKEAINSHAWRDLYQQALSLLELAKDTARERESDLIRVQEREQALRQQLRHEREHSAQLAAELNHLRTNQQQALIRALRGQGDALRGIHNTLTGEQP